MNRLQMSLFALLALAVVLVALLVMRNRQAPLLPEDDVHTGFVNAAACLQCHDVGGDVPRSRNHPLGDDCLRCHGSRP